MQRPLSQREHIKRAIAERRDLKRWEAAQTLRRNSFDLKCLEMRVGRIA